MADTTSPALASEGTLLQVLIDGTSPWQWNTVANVGDINGPAWSSTVVDVTSQSSQAPFRQKIVTLLDIGKMTAKVFWVPTNPTHANVIAANVEGLRYIYRNRHKMLYQLAYTDGTSADQFYAYITDLGEMATVAGVYEMTVTFQGTGQPIQMA